MPTHIAQHVRDFMTSHGVEVIPHTPHSSDLMSGDFFLFPTGKRDFKGGHFESPQAAPALGATETAFKRLAQNEFQQVFDEWQKRWMKCVALNGEYLEGAVVNTE